MADRLSSERVVTERARVALLLTRFSLRHARQAPRQTALLILILALGVAVFVSIRLANKAAVAGFSRFTETLTGQSDWTVQAPAGPLPMEALGEIRQALGSRPVHLVPVIETIASRPALAGEAERFGRPAYTLIGVDLLALANLARPQDRGYFGATIEPRGEGAREEPADGDFWSALNRGPRVWLSQEFAPVLPDHLDLILDERVVRVPVAGAIPTSPDAPRAPPTLMVVDLHDLQVLARREGTIDRIEIRVESGAGSARLREETGRILAELGQEGLRWNVVAPDTRRETTETMTRAFRLNLTILSLIALLVGLYLIFQALDGAVVRRRAEIAILRSLGVNERTIRNAWLAESAVLGVIGGGLGVLLGWAGAQLSVQAVGQTVNALYHATTVQGVGLSVGEMAIGLVLGLVAALVAGAAPARAAARTPPAQILQRSAAPAPGISRKTSLALGATLLLLGVIAAQLPPVQVAGGARFPWAGYGAALAWILGGGLVCGFGLRPIALLLRRVGVRFVTVRLALSHLRAPSGRHRLAVAALLCAVAMTAGMAILVASFERTVRDWVERSLQADLYLASGGAQSASAQNRISPAAAEALASHPSVAVASLYVVYPIQFDGRSTQLTATDLGILRRTLRTPWVQEPRDESVFDVNRNPDQVLVSESFSERFRVRAGDHLNVPTPSGVQRVVIAGIFADYGNDRGSILADLTHVRRWFRSDAVSSVSLFLKPGVDPAALRAEFLQTYPGLTIYANATLRSEILRIFRQTFAITYALEVIGVAVAVGGLALTLISVLLDRRDELTTLRALGWTHREIAAATALEGAAVSLCALVGGLLLSLALGWLLVYVINKQSFGWTLGFVVPTGQLAALSLAIGITGTAVSYWVGRWGADLPADREE